MAADDRPSRPRYPVGGRVDIHSNVRRRAHRCLCGVARRCDVRYRTPWFTGSARRATAGAGRVCRSRDCDTPSTPPPARAAGDRSVPWAEWTRSRRAPGTVGDRAGHRLDPGQICPQRGIRDHQCARHGIRRTQPAASTFRNNLVAADGWRVHPLARPCARPSAPTVSVGRLAVHVVGANGQGHDLLSCQFS